jgi:TatD DNase family protein
MGWLVDAHIHLSDPFYEKETDLIINGMQKMQIKGCCVSVDYTTSLKTLELSKKSNLILPFIGIHPQMASQETEPVLELINQNLHKLSGIGEIGLDKTYANTKEDFERQEHVFRQFLSQAEKLQKPISIHSRKTLDEIYQILSSYSLRGVLLHWFDGNKQQLKKAMDNGFYVSYGPVMVYAKDKQVLLENTDEDKILVETDGPVRFANCFGLKPAQISFIPSVVFCASNVLRKSYDELSQILEKNSDLYLGI